MMYSRYERAFLFTMALMLALAVMMLFTGLNGLANAQDDGDELPDDTVVIDAPSQAATAQSLVLDELNIWLDTTWKTAATFAIQVMVVVSIAKTGFFSLLGNDAELRLKEFKLRGLEVYNVALLGFVFLTSWIMVSSAFDWNPWQEAPFPGVAGLDTVIQNGMTAIFITVAAGVTHHITTGLGALFSYVVAWVRERISVV